MIRKKLLGKFLFYSIEWNTWNLSCIWIRLLWFGVFSLHGSTYFDINYDVMGKNSACGCILRTNCWSKCTLRPDSPRSFTVWLSDTYGCNLISQWIFTPESRCGYSFAVIHNNTPVPFAARSKALVCGRSPAEIVSSNPTGGMDICLLWVLCVVR
jgi:hypothetical protein